jgi:aldehyde dehydrogenase (NAD+)
MTSRTATAFDDTSGLDELPQVLTAVVGGTWTGRSDGTLHEVVDPATESAVRSFEESTASVVDSAVRDAHAAWIHRWGWIDPAVRGRALQRVADRFRQSAEPLARLESVDTGKPISQARADVAVTVRYLEYYAGMADKIAGETIAQPAGTLAYTLREPYGVVAHITPWNAPLSQMMRGVAPCLAAGNTVVVKPSELTPLSTALAARLMSEAGLPPGVCNVVLGEGATTGQALVAHELVRHVTFTGSVAAGRAVGHTAAERIIGCNLELGGKSPTIVMADADLQAAATAGALAVIRNSGQSCFATTRLIVHRSVHDEFVEQVAARMQGMSVGHGLEDPDLGPLISERQRARVLSLIDGARGDGADVVLGGEPPAGVDRGHFVMPTLISGVTNDMQIARDEVFGPVQSVLVFDEVEEAISIANDTEFGLSAGVFTREVGVAHYVASRLEAGQVQINRYAGAGVEVPFGGYKTSGLGREKGTEAIHHYTQLKSVIVATATRPAEEHG